MSHTIHYDFSTRLASKLDRVAPFMFLEAAKIWNGPRPDALYPHYLATMHSVVRSAVSLMDAALVECRLMEAADPISAALIPYLEHHREEERGHDEWLLEDLDETGNDRSMATEVMPSAEAAQLVGAQYYWIKHAHPVTLLGHMSAIEGYHPPKGFAAHLSEKTGYPISAFRAIRRHEILDIQHKADLHALLDTLPLTAKHQHFITISALHTMRAGAELMRYIAHQKTRLSA